MGENATVFPLSFAQRRLWFLNQLEPGNTFYNLPLAVPLNVPINASILERCINEIINRHETLRTTFDTINGDAIQIVHAALSLRLTVVDLRSLSKEEQDAETTRLSVEWSQRPFDLARGPLLRTALLQRGAQDHVLLLVIHHIVSDGWSLGILWRELIGLYNAFYLNLPSPLPELPIQYADFAVWQSKQLQGKKLAELISYWSVQLDRLPVLQLPTDRPRPPVLSYRGGLHDVVFSRQLSDALKTLSRRENVTLFMTLFAAFAVLLQRYTGQDDIVVGVPIAGRDHMELEGLIGFFVNTLVLRADLSGDPTFGTLMARVREAALDAYAHQELPFEKLVVELQPERDLSRNPLFQVSFQVFPVPDEGGLNQEEDAPAIAINRGSAIFDLAINLWESPKQIGGRLEFSTDLFDASTIARLADHFKTLLKSIAANPASRLSELELLGDAERRKLLFEWNDTQMPVPQLCVHELFERQVAQNPGALAIAADQMELSYHELNRRANQLADHLRALGIGRDMLVCVCVERGLSMVLGLLAILKAGGAYIPVDANYPPERLAYILKDSCAKVVLSERSVADRLPTLEATLLMLDDETVFAGWSEMNDHGGALPDDLCYIIYTSGSTGRPKGVEIPHRGLSNLAAWHLSAFSVTRFDRASQLASLAFDASTWELWPYLTAGASIHIISDKERASPSDLVKALIARNISIAFVPTPLAHLILDDPSHVGLRLRYLLTGGDKLTRAAPLGTAFTIVNNYGPTEYSVVATSCTLGARGSVPPPIGRPIANTRTYVLDRHLNPAPIGAIGELYIAGHGLARGYHNLPTLTWESFVKPTRGFADERLYKTGDLVRYRPDGFLDYVGRLDHQIKIRGFRIEPGEIEVMLTGHELVSDAIVIAHARTPENSYLVAYVVPTLRPAQNVTLEKSAHAPDGRTLATTLKRYLRTQLPDYMTPAEFVFLPSLPQSPNGKIDRAALTPPEGRGSDGGVTYAAPRTPLEKVLTNVWAEVLNLDQVGTDDNFFEIGGHSLLAAQLISRVRDRLKIDLTLQTLFRAPTPSQFAAAVLAHTSDSAATERAAQLVDSLTNLSEAEVKKMLAQYTGTLNKEV